MNRKFLAVIALSLASLTGCATDAEVASKNLSQDADNFQIARRVVFYNGITDKYMLSIEGNCSVDPRPADRMVDVICKMPTGKFIKNSLYTSDNSLWFSEQLDGVDVSTMQYRVIFKPESLIPDITRPGGAK